MINFIKFSKHLLDVAEKNSLTDILKSLTQTTSLLSSHCFLPQQPNYKDEQDFLSENSIYQKNLLLASPQTTKKSFLYIIAKNIGHIPESFKKKKFNNTNDRSEKKYAVIILIVCLLCCYLIARNKAKKKLRDIEEETSIAKTIQSVTMGSIEGYSDEAYKQLAFAFEKLGDFYLKKQLYTKANALYNMALTIEQNKISTKQENRIEQLNEKLFAVFHELVQKHSALIPMPLISQKEFQNTIEQHKEKLKEIRDNAKMQLNIFAQNVNLDPAQDWDYKIEGIKKIYQTLANDIKIYIKTLLKECYQTLGIPPCSYSIMGLGSFSREEVTPYSDFEFGILLEEGKDTEKNKSYFRNLTNLLHLHIINLGETILPAMAIESLNPMYRETTWTFFDDITERGLSFDGCMPQACKTPLGKLDKNGKVVYELIQTPSKMAGYVGKDQKGNYWYDKEPHLVTILSNAIYIDGDEYGKKMFDDYLLQVTKKLDEQHPSKQTLRHFIFYKSLSQDLQQFDPHVGSLEEEGKLFDAKKDLYRIPNLFLEALGFYYGLEHNSSWEKLKKLKEQKILSSVAIQRIAWLLSETMRFRLSTYLYYGRQKEWMNPLLVFFQQAEFRYLLTRGKNNALNNFEFKLEKFDLERLTLMYEILIPFHEAMKEFCSKKNDANLNSVNLIDTRYEIQGKIALRLYDYKKAKKCFKNALKKEPENPRLVKRYAGINFRLGNIKQAIEGYNKLLKILEQKQNEEQNAYEIAITYTNLGEILRVLGEYNKAEICHNKALDIWKNIFKQDTPLIMARGYNNLGLVYINQGKNKTAMKLLYKALAIVEQNKNHKDQKALLANAYSNLGAAFYECTGEHRQSANYFKKALELRKEIYGNMHPAVAESYGNLGVICTKLENTEEAKEYQIIALKIEKSIYGEKHYRTIRSYGNLAGALCGLGKLEEAKNYFKKSLKLKKTFYGVNSLAVARDYSNLGGVWEGLKDLKKAKSYHEKSLKIKEKLFMGIKSHELAISYHNLGGICDGIGDYEGAIKNYKIALEIYGNAMQYGDIAKTLGMLGETLYHRSYELRQTDIKKSIEFSQMAIKHYQDALENLHHLYPNELHLDIAYIYNDLGIVLHFLGDFKAISCFEKSLRIFTVLFRDKKIQHPMIKAVQQNLFDVTNKFHQLQQKNFPANTQVIPRDYLTVLENNVSDENQKNQYLFFNSDANFKKVEDKNIVKNNKNEKNI